MSEENCEICEGTGKLPIGPDEIETHPCDDCQPEEYKLWQEKQKPENPAAFPRIVPDYADAGFETGVTLRDWFAGMALQGMAQRALDARVTNADLAKDCYNAADALLEARGDD